MVYSRVILASTLHRGYASPCLCEFEITVGAFLQLHLCGLTDSTVMYADYSGQLTYLLRYPASPTPVSDTQHVPLLLRQALALQMAPSISTGTQVVYENRNLLGIPIELPVPPSTHMRRRPPLGDRGRSSSAVDSGSRKPEHARTTSSSMAELIARGLMDKSESLGINKTVMNAVSELKVSLK